MNRDEIINELAKINNAKNYLEVGVESGNTFNKVAIPNKVAVDPIKRFDPISGIFHEMESDIFFRNCTQKFDVIFLDGMHLFEFIFRDFYNATKVASEKAIIIIDDVIPSDVNAAERSQSFCVAQKIKLGSKDRNWMGDVYKFISFLDQIFIDWSYKTHKKNHGQTIIWREPRKFPVSSNVPKYYNFSDIAENNVPYNFSDFKQIVDHIKKVYV